jgi:hypothetical protein
MQVVGRQSGQPAHSVEARLESGEILLFTPCPFPLPTGEDLTFLFQQKIGGLGHKNISYHPQKNQVTGYEWHSSQQAENLGRLLHHFADTSKTWLADLCPGYAQDWRPDRVSLRTEEEATRRVRWSARNDLLHIDAFPSRPSRGSRILRLFVNLHPHEPRVWITADSFAALLDRYGKHLGLHQASLSRWAWKFGQGLWNLFGSESLARTEYDHFMLRLHHFLKSNDEYQEQARKKFWHFAPGSAWLAFTDGFTHAELRGRFALEHSFFVAPSALVLPDQSPFHLLELARNRGLSSRAA